MQHRLILPLVCCFAGFAGPALAVPVTLDKTNTVASMRTDPGTGICGSVIQYKVQQSPIQTKMDAANLLDKPSTDSNILGRKSIIFDNFNFRNADKGSTADFTVPGYIDTLFPYSADVNAAPPGTDEQIAMRARGYLNVKNTLGGQPVTFGVFCDDFCSLKIGKKDIIPLAHLQTGGRMTQQVIFRDTGLYPVEIVYGQNTNYAYLEWSRALSAEPEGSQMTPLDTNKFKIIPSADLYSAIVGSNPGCQECGAPGQDCSVGNFCGDGLCQPCNLPDHCGQTCQVCPESARLCNAGKCVQCTSDAMCPLPGQTCTDGQCKPPTACIADTDCPTGKICREDGFCGNPPSPCRTNDECAAGQICDPTKKVCVVPPTKCTKDSDCNMYQYCDTAIGECRNKNRYLYEGGLSGCSMSSSAHNGNSTSLAMLALLGMGLAGLSRRFRRRILLALPVFFCVAVTDAKAQTQAISLNAQIFHPAIGPENIITVEGTRTPGKWVPMANVLFEYAHQPLRFTDTFAVPPMPSSVPVVPYMFTLHLSGGIGLTRWLAIGVDLPIIVYEGYTKQTGTLADINAALDGLSFTPSLNSTATGVLNVSVDDLGHNGTGGNLTGTGTAVLATLPHALDPIENALRLRGELLDGAQLAQAVVQPHQEIQPRLARAQGCLGVAQRRDVEQHAHHAQRPGVVEHTQQQGALGVFVIHPGVDDHLARGVVAEEQSVLLEELGPEPVLVIVTERPTLAVLRSRRILRDDIERQLGDRGQPLAGVLFYVPGRVLLLQGLDLPHQRFNLRQEQWMGEDRPAMNDQGLGPPHAHSSSSNRAASRSTSTPPTSDWMRWTRPASTACSRSGWRVMSAARKPRN